MEKLNPWVVRGEMIPVWLLAPIPLIIALYFAFAMDADGFHQCPPGTFLFTFAHPWFGAVSIVFLAFLPLGALSQSWKGIRRVRDEERRREWRGKWFLGLACISLINLALWSLFAFGPTCLAEDGIHHRNWAWQDFRTQDWRDVVAVSTACQGKYSRSYVLTMRDGTRFDIAHTPSLADGFPELRKQLAAATFQFNASGVGDNCHLGRELFRQRP